MSLCSCLASSGSDGSSSSSVSSSSGSSSSSTSSSSLSSDGSFPSSSSSSSSTSKPVNEAYDAFWDLSSLTNVSLSFSNASLYALSHYGSIDDQKWGDLYFPADMTISYGSSSFTLDEVGVRMKGNTSRTAFVNEDGSFMDGKYAHLKVSFKATFDDDLYDLSQFKAFKHDWSTDADGRKSRKDRKVCSMEKVDFKVLPRNDNKTYSQQMYCYKTFRDNGIEAPYAKWSNVTIKDDSDTRTSYFEMVEDIDKKFLTNHFGKDENGGDLYKCVWGAYNGEWKGSDLSRTGAVDKTFDANGYSNGARVSKGRIGVEDDYNMYHPNYQLKTNDDDGEDSDFSKMANYINAVYSCRFKGAPLSLLQGVLDIDQFLRFEALSFLFGNFDDQRMNYNNYYLYFRESDGKAIYIPYDWDWCLGNDGGHDMVNLDPFYTTSLDGTSNGNNIYWDTILVDSSYKHYEQTSMQTTYKNYMKDALNNGALSKDGYGSMVASFPKKDELSSVQTYMDNKKSYVEARI